MSGLLQIIPYILSFVFSILIIYRSKLNNNDVYMNMICYSSGVHYLSLIDSRTDYWYCKDVFAVTFGDLMHTCSTTLLGSIHWLPNVVLVNL